MTKWWRDNFGQLGSFRRGSVPTDPRRARITPPGASKAERDQTVVVLTSGHPCERVGKLPPGVGYMPKPWQPLNVLIAPNRR
jgi:hypothetical protein